jgi:glycosyltransferase involved in cell wall biosynthesis
MSPKVCILTSVHPPFDGRIFHRQAVSLANAGYEVTLIAPASFERKKKEGITVIGFPKARRRIHRPLSWWKIFRRVRRVHPNVVHFHDPELLLLVPILRLVFGRRLLIVYDVHEYFIDSLAVKFWLPAFLRPVVIIVAGWLEKLLARQVNGIVCAVEGQVHLYKQLNKPTVVVRNLPIVSLFQDPIPIPEMDINAFKLIYVGLILPSRGINVLLQAMNYLREWDYSDVMLYLVGDFKSRDYYEEILTFIDERQLHNQIKLMGFIEHSDLKNYLNSSDVGMAPGLISQQYGNPGIATKLFEYMLCNLPIVCADLPHRSIYIDEANCGIVVPQANPKAFAEAVSWLKNNPQEAEEMGRRGRTMVLDRYSWEFEQGKLLQFYHKLVSRNQLVNMIS